MERWREGLTPTPGYVVRQRSSDQGTDNCRDAKRGRDDAQACLVGKSACSARVRMNREYIPALRSNAIEVAMIVIAPEASPDPPIPATALPTINAFELGAVAQTKEPSSNINRKAKKVYCSQGKQMGIARGRPEDLLSTRIACKSGRSTAAGSNWQEGRHWHTIQHPQWKRSK
jgi:hypothetical protein